MTTKTTIPGSALSRVQDAYQARTGNPIQGTSIRCPLPEHDDSNASASLSAKEHGNPGAQVYCHRCSSSMGQAEYATRFAEVIGLTTPQMFDDWSEDFTPAPRYEVNVDSQREALLDLQRQIQSGHVPLTPPTPPSPSPLGQPVATYTYTDVGGNPVMRRLRYEPKAFRQQSWDGTQWVNGLNGCARPLYRLPDVLAAVEAGEEIYLLEGEKDVHTLLDLGLIGTTNGSAGTWREEHTEVLAGAQVNIVADNDQAGRDHAKDVASALRGVGCDVWTFVPAPECRDFTQHIEAGHDPVVLRAWINDEGEEVEIPLWDGSGYVERVAEIDEEAVFGVPRPVDFLSMGKAEVPEPDWICYPIIPGRNQATHLYAPANQGKTTLSTWIAAMLAMGFDPFDPLNNTIGYRDKLRNEGRTNPIRVLYIDHENGEDNLHEKLKRDFAFEWNDFVALSEHLVYYALQPIATGLDSTPGAAQFLMLVDDVDPDVVIVDSIAGVVTGEENSNDTFSRLMSCALGPLRARGIPSLWMGNTGHDRLSPRPRGGSRKVDIMDCMWSYEQGAEGSGETILTNTKSRSSWIPKRVQLRFNCAGDQCWYNLDQSSERFQTKSQVKKAEARAAKDDAAIQEIVALLDDLSLPDDATRSAASKALKENGTGRSNNRVASAVAIRQDRVAK